MHFPVERTRKTLLFFAVLTSWTIGIGETTDDTLNLRIGFDLTQGTNGAPSLRIRNFEESDGSDSERHLRAEEEEENKDDKASPAIRADSFSDDDGKAKHGESSREEDANSSDGSGEEESGKLRSTRGLRPGEFEPEDNPRIHGRYQDEEDNSDGEARRKKREVEYEAMKRKSKKFRSARKQGVSRA